MNKVYSKLCNDLDILSDDMYILIYDFYDSNLITFSDANFLKSRFDDFILNFEACFELNYALDNNIK